MVNEVCVLCQSQLESRNHLFFECDFSKAIWREGVRRNCTALGSTQWRDIVDYLQQISNQKGLRKIMMRLFWSMAVYRVWSERNRCRHGQQAESVNQVVSRICLDLKHVKLDEEQSSLLQQKQEEKKNNQKERKSREKREERIRTSH